jgi:hypothetical protein
MASRAGVSKLAGGAASAGPGPAKRPMSRAVPKKRATYRFKLDFIIPLRLAD